MERNPDFFSEESEEFQPKSIFLNNLFYKTANVGNTRLFVYLAISWDIQFLK